MKNSNFIKNSMLALLPISVGLSVLFGVKSPIRSVEAYTGASLPTTIDLNDPSNSTIRSYYSNLNNLSDSERKGDNLLKNLKTILSNGQKYYNYDSGDLVWKMYEITDRDWDKSPAGSDSVGTYDSTTNVISNYRYGSNSSHTNNPYIRAYYMDRSQENVVRAWGNHNQDATGINREHLWAKAEGFDGSGAAGARGDPMHLVAANGYANNKHSNNFYGYVDKTRNYEDVKDKYSTLGHNYSGYSQTYPSSTITVFEPQDCDKGDIARAIFYMAARYNNIAGKSASQETFDADNPNLLLTNDLSKWKTSGYTSTATSPGYHGLITDLLEWNRIDPPDDYEIHRNNLLYTNFTNNRNPFIDFPQWADICWGNSTSSADPVSDPLNGTSSVKTVTSLTVSSAPTKTVYTEGESFSTDGLVVKANFNDGTSSTITDYTYSPSGALSYGTNKITISYGEKTIDVPITVIRGDTPKIKYFKKVTSNLTSGQYLIVCDDSNLAWKTGAVTANDTIAVTKDEFENIVYTSELEDAMFTFDLTNGSVLNPNGKYIYNDSDTANVKYSDEPVSNTISVSDGVLNISGPSTLVKYNYVSSSENSFFKFYKSTSSGMKFVSAYALVEEEDVVHPTDVNVSPANLTLEIGSSSLLSAEVLPSDATENTVTWSSDDTDVVAVDQTGRIVAVGAGTAHITAQSNDSKVDISGSCTVTVPQPIELDSLTVTGDYKKTYYVDESFDMTNLVVNGIYIQGGQQAKVENVTDDAEFSGFDTSSVGTKTITVSYNGLTTTFDISVLEIPVEENTVKIVTSTYAFDNGDKVSEVDKDNFKVTFSKGTNTNNCPTYYTSGSAIRVYGGNTFKITGPNKIIGVKLVFASGEGSNTITVDRGTWNESTDRWNSAVGVDDVTFTIGGSSGHRRISEIHIVYDPDSTTTKELLSISLSGEYPTSFDVGETFSYEGLVVTAHYNDGSEATVTPDSVTGEDMETAGEQEITVSYSENEVTKTTTYTINVIKTIVLDYIVLGGTYKTSFFVGDKFDRKGLVVTAYYSNGDSKVVNPTSVTGYNMDNPSESQTIKVSYLEGDIEVCETYTIEVKDILPASLKVSDIEQTDYVVGDEFNDNFTATVTYNNGDEEVVTPTSIEGYNMSTSGEQTVTVKYTEKETTVSDSYTIQVDKKVPVSLVISGEFKTTFNVGDSFTHDGLVATVKFNNGSSSVVNPTFSTPDMSTKGTEVITVSYTQNGETASATYNITVNAIVHSVSLNESSMSIDLHDAVSKTLTATVDADAGADYELDWSVLDPSVVSINESGNSVSITPLKVGSTSVSVEAGGKSATCIINVTSLVSLIEISGENTVELGGNIQLSAAILPSDAVANEVEWSTSNSSILAISASGNNVTVSAVGSSGQKATITASAKDGSEVSDSIEITIISIESIRIEYSGIDNDNKVPFAKYKLGESVDAHVIAVWSNGQTLDVTESASKQFKISTFVLGEQTISASYQGFNASLTLKVTNEGSEAYVGYNSKTRANGEYNATPLEQAEAWADYFIRLTGGGEFDGPCKLPADQRKDALLAVWDELNSEYGYMTDASKDTFCSDTTTSAKIIEAMNHYKFVCRNYSLTQFVENSQHVKPAINSSRSLEVIKNISITSVVILVIVGIVVIAIFVAVKKNKKRV